MEKPKLMFRSEAEVESLKKRLGKYDGNFPTAVFGDLHSRFTLPRYFFDHQNHQGFPSERKLQIDVQKVFNFRQGLVTSTSPVHVQVFQKRRTEKMVITTWKFRIKDSSAAGRKLVRMARAVNFVWNFAKETQVNALRAKSARLISDKKTGKLIGIPNFLSAYELNNLVAGSSKELCLHSQTVQSVTEEYARRRKQFGKLLRWRGRKSPGWVPFKSSGIKISGDSVSFSGEIFKVWKSREFPSDARFKTGSFSQDKRGRWSFNISFDSELLVCAQGDEEVGIDIGIKTLASLSDGSKIERPNLRADFLAKMRKLEKTRKFARRKAAQNRKFGTLPKVKQERNLAAKVANKRQDYLHKESTKLVARTKLIVVGNVPCKLMNCSKNMSGISLDSGIGLFKAMLSYKAARAGSTYFEVSERDSTQTCSNCGLKSPRRIELGVREWSCEGCGSLHDRDINAARNILRTGRGALTRCA